MTASITARSLGDSPELTADFLGMRTMWPPFIEPSRLLAGWGIHAHRQHQLVLLDGDEIVARAAALPLSWDGDPSHLPMRGWDEVIERSMVDTFSGDDLSTLCALEVSVATGHEGEGLSSTALNAVRHHGRDAGFRRLIAPVRPSGKTERPELPMNEYVGRRRTDGLPVDNWLRVHERLGGQIIGVCPTAMSVIAPLHKWREWTRLPLAKSGSVIVPGGIAPVLVNIDHDYAAYVEANVWVSHAIPAEHTKDGDFC